MELQSLKKDMILKPHNLINLINQSNNSHKANLQKKDKTCLGEVTKNKKEPKKVELLLMVYIQLRVDQMCMKMKKKELYVLGMN